MSAPDVREENTKVDDFAACMAVRSSILVQLLALPLPLICSGKGDYENVKNVGNSHDLIAAILGRILIMTKEKEQELVREILYGTHVDDLFSAVKKANGSFEQGYEALCTYTRAVICKLVEMDTGGFAQSSQQLDIRFVRDPSVISVSQHSSLVDNAVAYCKALSAYSTKSDSEKATTDRKYDCCVQANLMKLREIVSCQM
jgi:hypothetical protein